MVSFITVGLAILVSFLLIANAVVSSFPKRKKGVHVTFVPPSAVSGSIQSPRENAWLVSMNQKILQINFRLSEIEKHVFQNPLSKEAEIFSIEEKKETGKKKKRESKIKLKKSVSEKQRVEGSEWVENPSLREIAVLTRLPSGKRT